MYAVCKLKNISGETKTYCGQELTANQEYLIPDTERTSWANDDDVIAAIPIADLQVGDGSQWLTSYADQLDLLRNTNAEERDLSNKSMVHQSSCPLGSVTGWFGAGDDAADPHKVGGGQRMICHHKVGDANPLVVVADLNIKENATYIHEGFIKSLDAKLDYIHGEIIPVVTNTTAGSGTNFLNYGGIIIPSAAGGNINVAFADMKPVQIFTDVNTKVKAPAYWNFDYDEDTHAFSNPTAAPNGDGNYNMFSSEDVAGTFPKRFWHSHTLLGNLSEWMQSDDAVPLGCNLRIRLKFYTHIDGTDVPDHEWFAAVTSVFHRKRLI